MALFDLTALPQLERLSGEAEKIRRALDTIAQCLVKLTEVPAGPSSPQVPIGPESIGSYAAVVMDAENADDMRERLRAQGLTDPDIERQLVGMIFGEEDDQST
jgi:hypothetical protein